MNQAQKIAQIVERIGRLVANTQHADGFKPVQWEVLRYLSEANVFSRNPSALGEYLGITKGSVSQTVSTLEQHDLLRKKSDKTDKRVVRLELTPAGRSLLAENPLQELSATAEKLPAKQQAQLATGLEALLREHLNQQDRKPFGLCRDCRHLQVSDGAVHCGLLNVPLKAEHTELICAEFSA